jgi:hypothetical protein
MADSGTTTKDQTKKHDARKFHDPTTIPPRKIDAPGLTNEIGAIEV